MAHEMYPSSLEKNKENITIERFEHHIFDCEECKKTGNPQIILNTNVKRFRGYIERDSALNLQTNVLLHEHALGILMDIAKKHSLKFPEEDLPKRKLKADYTVSNIQQVGLVVAMIVGIGMLGATIYKILRDTDTPEKEQQAPPPVNIPAKPVDSLVRDTTKHKP